MRFDLKKIILGFVVFAGITGLSIWYLAKKTYGEVDLSYLLDIKAIFWIIFAFFCFNEAFLGGYRNHIFARVFKPGISQWVCFNANLANIFMGAVTPGQTGGGVAQMYYWHKNGLSVSHIATISFINWVSTLVFFPFSGLIAYSILGDQADSSFMHYILKYGTGLYAILLVVILTIVVFPLAAGNLFNTLGNWAALFNDRLAVKLKKWGDSMAQKMLEYRTSVYELMKTRPELLLYSFILTVILYFNKYALAYFIVLALGVESSFWEVVSIQAMLYFILYFAPSPGGSGIAEVSIAGLMAPILAPDLITSFTLLYRSLLVFIPAILGAVVIGFLVKNQAEKNI